ncbi:putative polysaccharide biosynthesis protein [Megasphaera vaginalis (ex Srinivasan et al. 2021)]|uniref:Putative stage V sporulation protein B n=1 Tax=Megasphaera vaginalis (ex Srinivasan et al. 2021) TaxID=1111454 RepID=U7UST7_9FIRM|nr:polysaccharide biosynthesis protein [Megasphaera vaginalis (ex Srinivasan et al. 2021)]ERT61959.1 putative stage V sporulation protein B [Megasphaera vaginalis (ex Srinivasan et al. 2021)]
MRKTSFLRGAMILTVAGVVVKMLGGVNRILLSRILGGEGIGLYQMAYPLYILLLSIAGAGIPIAVSILVAEKASQSAYGEGRRILKIALLALGGCGVLLAAAMIPAASILVSAGIVSDGRVQLSLAVLAPALAISIVTCCFRGYFQGLQLMTPTAVSQMCDQFIRVCVMLSLAFLLFPSGLEKAAAGAAFGAVPGAAAGLAVMLFFYFRHLRSAEYAALSNGAAARESSLHIVRRLLTLAIPVAAANMLLPAVASIDLFIVPHRLTEAGYTISEATTHFGYLSGMANGLIQLPAILTIALSTSLVPAVSAAYTGGTRSDVLRRTHAAMAIANLITVPSFFGLAVLATPISRLLYGTAAAGPAICVLSLAAFLIGVQQVTSGLLQGIGKACVPLYCILVAAVLKIGLSWYLTALPWLGEAGAAWATNADLAVAAALNLWFAGRYVAYRMDWLHLGKIFLSAAAMAGTAWIVSEISGPLLPDTAATLLAIGTAAVVYLVSLLAFRAVDSELVGKIPVVGAKLKNVSDHLRK